MSHDPSQMQILASNHLFHVWSIRGSQKGAFFSWAVVKRHYWEWNGLSGEEYEQNQVVVGKAHQKDGVWKALWKPTISKFICKI